MSDGVTITCTCGHEAPLDAFTHTVCGELPNGSFQCPHCRTAWRIEKTPIQVHRFIYQGKPEVRLISEPNQIVRVNSYL